MKPKIKLPNPPFQRAWEGLQQKLGGVFCCSCCVPVLWRVFTNGSNVHERLRCMSNKILEGWWEKPN
jgi:hypothetical protein